MADIITIRNEEDALRILEQALDEQWQDDDVIKFSGWPNFEIVIRGERFHGGVPTRIMPVLIELQKIINNTYSKYKYGKIKRLTKDEKYITEITVNLGDEQSTEFLVGLVEILNNLIKFKEPKKNLAILVFGTILGTGGTALKLHLQDAADERDFQLELKHTENEAKLIDIVKILIEKDNETKEILKELIKVNETLIKKLDEKDIIVSGGEEIITGKEAKQIQRKKPSPTIKSELSGDFLILKVDTTISEKEFKLVIQNQEDKKKYPALLSLEILNDDQRVALQNGEWGKIPVSLNLDLKTRGKKVISAIITGVNN